MCQISVLRHIHVLIEMILLIFQIINFLKSHSHPEMLKSVSVKYKQMFS